MQPISLIVFMLVSLQVAGFDIPIPLPSPSVPSFSQCRHDTEIYASGSKFHPKIYSSNGRQYELLCTVCTCMETTLIQCEKVICPPVNCTRPLIRVKGECCDICIEFSPPTFRPSLATTDPIIRAGSSSCEINGMVYSDGEKFHPNTENSTANPFCTSCQCKNGNITCSDVSASCPALNCPASQAVTPNRSCCKTCSNSRGTCLDPLTPSITHQEGTWWQPILRGTPLTCMNCTCTNGIAKCDRLPCPPVPPCSGERHFSIVVCCPPCENVRRNQTNSSNDVTASLPVPTLEPCISSYTHKVYQCPDNLSVALENTTSNLVQIFSWLPAGLKQFTPMSSGFFRTHPCFTKFRGLAKEQRVRGLTSRRAKRELIQNCTSNCPELIIRMLRPVKTAPDCSR